MGWPRKKASPGNERDRPAQDVAVRQGRLACCPVVCGRPTRMLEETFLRMCGQHQEYEGSWCRDVCRGKLLPETLEFITIATIERSAEKTKTEDTMPARRDGICDVCKGEKNIGTVYHKRTCSTCGFFVRGAKTTPKLLLQELIEVWGKGLFVMLAEMGLHPDAPELDGDTAEDRMDVHAITDTTAELEAAALELGLQKQRVEYYQSLEAELCLILKCDQKSYLEEFARSRMEQLEHYREQSDQLQAELIVQREQGDDPGTLIYESTGLIVPGRESALLDIALDVIAGKVLGIDAQRLSSLR